MGYSPWVREQWDMTEHAHTTGLLRDPWKGVQGPLGVGVWGFHENSKRHIEGLELCCRLVFENRRK